MKARNQTPVPRQRPTRAKLARTVWLLLICAALLPGGGCRGEATICPDSVTMRPVIEAWLIANQDQIAASVSRQVTRDSTVTEGRASSAVVRIADLEQDAEFAWATVTVIEGDSYGEVKYRVSMRIPATAELCFGTEVETRHYLVHLDLWLGAAGQTITGWQTVAGSYLAEPQ